MLFSKEIISVLNFYILTYKHKDKYINAENYVAFITVSIFCFICDIYKIYHFISLWIFSECGIFETER